MSIDLEAIKIVTFEALLGTKLSFYEMAKDFDWKVTYENVTKALLESKSAREASEKLCALAKKEEELDLLIETILEDLFDNSDLKDLQAIINTRGLPRKTRRERSQKKYRMRPIVGAKYRDKAKP